MSARNNKAEVKERGWRQRPNKSRGYFCAEVVQLEAQIVLARNSHYPVVAG